jgi:hypothetical protein
MKRSSSIFLRTALIFIGVGVLAFLLWEPHVEGRNAHATLIEIYFKDPFLAYAYIASIPFFVALYQAFKLVGDHRSVKAWRTIKRCGVLLTGFVAGGLAWILLSDSDDRAGGVFMGILIAGASLIVTAVATKFVNRA